LLTIKEQKALAEANVVLYDALANEELLLRSQACLENICWKRKGCHAYARPNQPTYLDNALTYGHVVRRKR
jgi:uroporphyrin-III C-methyltransferase